MLSITICVGLVISYLPQLVRIVRTGSSEGFSPWYLLLGATSSASGMLNLWILQWSLVRCCHSVVSLAKVQCGIYSATTGYEREWSYYSPTHLGATNKIASIRLAKGHRNMVEPDCYSRLTVCRVKGKKVPCSPYRLWSHIGRRRCGNGRRINSIA